MLRSIVCAGFAFVLCAITVLAKEYKDVTVTKIDGDKVTAKVDDKEKVFTINDKTAYFGGKNGDKELPKEVLEKIGKAAEDKGVKATIVTDDDDKVATKITFQFRGKGGKDGKGDKDKGDKDKGDKDKGDKEKGDKDKAGKDKGDK